MCVKNGPHHVIPPFIHPVLNTLHTPVFTPMYTCYTCVYTPYIHLTHTSKHPIYALHIPPNYTTCIHGYSWVASPPSSGVFDMFKTIPRLFHCHNPSLGYVRTTLFLWFAWFMQSYVFYGLIYIVPETLHAAQVNRFIFSILLSSK